MSDGLLWTLRFATLPLSQTLPFTPCNLKPPPVRKRLAPWLGETNLNCTLLGNFPPVFQQLLKLSILVQRHSLLFGRKRAETIRAASSSSIHCVLPLALCRGQM